VLFNAGSCDVHCPSKLCVWLFSIFDDDKFVKIVITTSDHYPPSWISADDGVPAVGRRRERADASLWRMLCNLISALERFYLP